MDSLRSESHSDRSEPRQGCCQLREKSEKRGSWGQVQGVSKPQTKLLLPIAPLVASLTGNLRV